MIRIYALAKELNIESKILVEACEKAGLGSKGSALASLTDEEVTLVKTCLKKAPPTKSARELVSDTPVMPMLRPTVSLQTGKIPVLKPTRPVRLPERPVKEKETIPPEDKSDTVDVPETSKPESEIPAKKPTVKKPAKKEEKEKPAEESLPAEGQTVDSAIQTSDQETLSEKANVKSATQEMAAAEKPSAAVEIPSAAVEKPTVSVEKPSAAAEKPSTAAEKPSTAAEKPTVTVGTGVPKLRPLTPGGIPVKPKKVPPLKSLLHPNKKAEAEAERSDAPEKTAPAPEQKPETAPPAPPQDSEPVVTEAEAPVEAAAPVIPPKAPLSPLELARRAAAMERMQRPQVIGEGAEKKKRIKPEDAKSARSATKSPGIHLAPLPTAPEKPAKKKAKEPTPQKPDIRFTPGVIKDASEGKSAPLTQIMRERLDDKKGTKDSKTKAGKRGSTPAAGTGIVYVSPEEEAERKGKSRGKGRGRGEEEDLGGKKRRAGGETRRLHDDGDRSTERYYQRGFRQKKGKNAVSTVPRKGDIVIEMPCTVKGFAEATGLSVAAVIKKIMELGAMMTINQPLDQEMAELLVEAFQLKAVVKREQTLEDQFVNTALEQEDPEETLRPRTPVVTFLGHVDHGKTSLLDRILHLNVVSGEKGGITQHIRSYRVTTKGGDVTFVDTPGHEAFTEMRARGANCTDIAVLVVAADDGVMPQTEEAISHAKAAGVPIVVALNKMDLPGVNRDRIIQELAANDLMPSEWGGDVEIVETSAVTGKGIDELMETLLTVAELHELRARPDRPATGVVLESSLDADQGVLCKTLVQNGTLRPGDIILCGNAYGRVRAMTDTLDSSKEMAEAGPSTPVTLLGLDIAPPAGSKFVVLDDISVARQIAEERTQQLHERELAGGESHVTLETLRERIAGAKTQQTLHIIIRADVRGSIEAIRKELGKLEHPEVKVKILQASVGGITEADVLLADASDAIIVGFSVVPDERARVLADQKKVQIRRYDIIYKLTEDIKAALEGMLKPIEQVKELGRALVQRTFNISRVGTIAGCRVLSGTIERDCRVRVIRDSRIIGEYQVDTLKREKDDAKEVREGYECGIKLKGYNDLKEGDVFEAYKIEEIARTF